MARTGQSTKKASAAAAGAKRAVGQAITAVAARVRPNENDAVAMLKRDHRKLEELFEQGEKTSTRSRRQRIELLRRIAAELEAHESIEEKVFYPALKRHAKARDIVLEGYQEHHVADILVEELHALPPSDERWAAKFKVLKENIEHHIEEEEGEMFRTARAVLSARQLQALGVRMKAMKGGAA